MSNPLWARVGGAHDRVSQGRRKIEQGTDRVRILLGAELRPSLMQLRVRVWTNLLGSVVHRLDTAFH